MVRTSLSNQSSAPGITSYAEFPSLPRPQYSSNYMYGHQTPNGNQTPQKEIDLTSKPVKLQQSSSLRHSIDEITIPTESFFSFIAEVIKNTLITFSENKPLSVENIVAKSAAANLVSCVWIPICLLHNYPLKNATKPPPWTYRNPQNPSQAKWISLSFNGIAEGYIEKSMSWRVIWIKPKHSLTS